MSFMPSASRPARAPRSREEPEPQETDAFLPAEHRHEVRYGEAEEGLEEDAYSQHDLENQVRTAQDRLKNLREQQEAVQRQKMELEELNARQAEFREGRQDILDRMVRASARLDKQAADLERRGEAMRYAIQTFREHLQILESLRPEEWSSMELSEELERSLGLIRTANGDYDREMKRLEGMAVEIGGSAHSWLAHLKQFGGWTLRGFAYSLPIIILGVIALIMWANHSQPSL